MSIERVFNICQDNDRRPIVIADGNSAVVAALGMEGRLFYAHNGEMASLFRPEAAENISNQRNGFFNPGGDGLWPAPEGTCFGYEYSTGSWRVPASLSNAQYEVIALESDYFEIAEDIDLVNNQLLGIPCRFTRKCKVHEEADNTTVIEQFDAIEYIGSRELDRSEFLLAPWSLSQFFVDDKTIARFGSIPGTVRDLYAPSQELLTVKGEVTEMVHDKNNRIQLALPEECRFVELLCPEKNLCITRTSAPLSEGLEAVDIADAPVDTVPAGAVRFSIYNDPSGFMELEVAGGCVKEKLTPGTVLGVNICNKIKTLED